MHHHSKILAPRQDFLAGGAQDQSMLPLGHIASILVGQGRVGVQDSILSQVTQRKHIGWEVQLLQPSLAEAEGVELCQWKYTFSLIRL